MNIFRKNTPETLRFRGILRLDTMYLAVLNIFIYSAVHSSISLRYISVGRSPYKFSDKCPCVSKLPPAINLRICTAHC